VTVIVNVFGSPFSAVTVKVTGLLKFKVEGRLWVAFGLVGTTSTILLDTVGQLSGLVGHVPTVAPPVGGVFG